MRVTGDHINFIPAPSRMQPASRQTAAGDAATSHEPISSNRALIPLSPVRHSERTQVATRQAANFLAHLIATDQAIPQTRERRRLAPSIAAAAYAAARDIVARETAI